MRASVGSSTWSLPLTRSENRSMTPLFRVMTPFLKGQKETLGTDDYIFGGDEFAFSNSAEALFPASVLLVGLGAVGLDGLLLLPAALTQPRQLGRKHTRLKTFDRPKNVVSGT